MSFSYFPSMVSLPSGKDYTDADENTDFLWFDCLADSLQYLQEYVFKAFTDNGKFFSFSFLLEFHRQSVVVLLNNLKA